MSVRPFVVMLRPLGLGDFLTGIPAYRAVARAFPDHDAVLAAPQALAPLAGLVTAIARFEHTLPLEPLAAELNGAAVAVDLHGNGPQSKRILLAAQPRRLISFSHTDVSLSHAGAAWRADEHEVQRWCRMLEHAGIPTQAGDLDLPLPPVEPAPIARRATLLHPSAASEARRWPIDRWAALARDELRLGRRVIITGAAGDRGRAAAIAELAGIALDCVYAGRTDLLELAALVAAAGRVVCGDTGVAHLATAYRTPSVVLFGPVPPQQWGPPADRSYHRALWTGKVGDPHGRQIDRGLLEIGVADVRSALDQLDVLDADPRAINA